jgi:hypothetical protein
MAINYFHLLFQTFLVLYLRVNNPSKTMENLSLSWSVCVGSLKLYKLHNSNTIPDD